MDKENHKVHPESPHGVERDEAWKGIVSVAAGFGKYDISTDRLIPVIRLTPYTVA